jgi:hypothetical protein
MTSDEPRSARVPTAAADEFIERLPFGNETKIAGIVTRGDYSRLHAGNSALQDGGLAWFHLQVL